MQSGPSYTPHDWLAPSGIGAPRGRGTRLTAAAGVSLFCAWASLPASPGSGGAAVAEAQALLNKLGYNVGANDGRMGSRTANAIRLFQLQTGLKVTGEVTPELLDAMREKAG